MRVKSDKGTTEVHFKDFVAVVPACETVRKGYRRACIDKPTQKDQHGDKVHTWASRNFGQNTYMADFDRHCGESQSPVQRLKAWDEWIAANPAQIKKYYDPTIVAACIMGEDE